jgi:glycosyltransferase involved in cell wall biosynthesis
MGDPMQAPYKILLMHPMDPRGGKLGGIETHVRLILSRHPDDFSILFVGVDEFGDCKLGEVRKVDVAGRQIDFLPVASIDATRINLPGRTLLQSTTFRFAVGAARYLPRLRCLVKGASISADLQRLEFALIPKLLGLKTVQMVHGEGRKDQEMDSLIKKLWFIHRTNEWIALRLADRVLCVNENIIRRFENVLPFAVRKSEVMTVSVDTARFAPKPFDTKDGVFRIVFAGRLDAFKDPPLMFRTLAALHARLAGKLEFHYLGTTDPNRYAEFAAIESFTVRHGFQTAAGVAGVVEKCHAGILTSYFEGMPCYLLETLSVGRPFAAIRLPQYDPLVVQGVSGTLVERSTPNEACCADLVDAFVALWDDIRAGRIDPEAVHRLVEPYSIASQMARLFAHHRALQAHGGTPHRAGRRAFGPAAEA